MSSNYVSNKDFFGICCFLIYFKALYIHPVTRIDCSSSKNGIQIIWDCLKVQYYILVYFKKSIWMKNNREIRNSLDILYHKVIFAEIIVFLEKVIDVKLI